MANDGNPVGLVRFDQNPWTRFFMCRSCKNHLVTLRNSDVTNVEDTWYVHRDAVVNVACKRCNSGLGHKVISAVARREGREIVFDREENFLLDRDAMVFWNGNRVVYADTYKPVEDN